MDKGLFTAFDRRIAEEEHEADVNGLDIPECAEYLGKVEALREARDLISDRVREFLACIDFEIKTQNDRRLVLCEKIADVHAEGIRESVDIRNFAAMHAELAERVAKAEQLQAVRKGFVRVFGVKEQP